ncbi:MAG: hypothetical protein ACYTFK_05735 [Planctomycetota bacterium]|jgi:hypothetical protein
MKNSKTYGQKIEKLFRSLKKKSAKVNKVTFDEPAYALVYGIVSERIRASAAKKIMRRLEKHFVDLNDLRVSRTEEILEILGSAKEDYRNIASVLRQVLNSIYDTHNIVSLVSLKELGKRQAKKEIEKLEGVSSFALNYCFLTAMRGHSIPLTPKMIEYLKAAELVHPEACDDEISGFLERQISAANAYEFYCLLRQESEKAKKARVVKKTVKRAVKKTVRVKKTVKKSRKETAKTRKS